MPSLFSRSRTNSTPRKSFLSSTPEEDPSPFDEFGRSVSRSSGHAVNVSVSAKKDRRREKEKEKARLRTLSSSKEDYGPTPDLFASIPDGSFLPLNLERPRDDAGDERPKEHDYGYLSYERHVVLGLEEVARLVDIVADELGTRGLTTPFIFSTLALDISASAIKRLIRAFLRSCSSPSAESDRAWREEARFASPHELGMCLRWGLARVVRLVGGQDYRGLVAWEHYVEFRDSEAALDFPPAHFQTFLPALPNLLRGIILTLLSLLIRFTAHSASSGHTPPTLSPLFGPLIFGLGPATLAFQHTYHHYLRATNAMEHLLLAFIRWQDTPRTTSTNSLDIKTDVLHGSATALGVPTRLKDWIRGYPSMLPPIERGKHERPQARRGARTVRVINVRRNVRMYSADLVKTAASWAHRPKLAVTSNGDRGLAGSKEWDRISPTTLKLPPRYSEGYKKRMDMPQNFHPDTGLGANVVMNSPSNSSSTSSGTSNTPIDDKDFLNLAHRENEDRFRSLTDLKWGEFEEMGFSTLAADEKKLQFDLTEGARTARAAKRATLSWNDFSASGFSRSDAPLNATLQFSTPVAHTISSWPNQNAELHKKLKKTQRSLPPFGWDTEPVMGSEEVIEEAFLDVFCDLVYGGGWMDLERAETTDRECNWALVEFKSLPMTRSGTFSAGSDPRTSTTLMLFEEFVPFEYREKLAITTTARRRLPSLFSSTGKSKQWKPAATLNGRPYVVGHVPRSPSYREVEFEGLLRGNGSATKVISLGGSKAPNAPVSSTGQPIASASLRFEAPTTPKLQVSSPLFVSPRSDSPLNLKLKPTTSTERADSPKKRFRLPGGIPVPSPGGMRKSGMVPAEYSTVDFETRLASYSDDELNGSAGDASRATSKEERRRSRDDAWVDILVATHSRRLGGQDAELRKRGLKGGRSDPELASQEVALALAGVRARSPLSDDGDNVIEAVSVSKIEEHYLGNNMTDVGAEDGETEHDHNHELDHEEEQQDQEPEPEPDTGSVVSYPQPQRRLGYFDLHPERRPVKEDDMSTQNVTENDEDDEKVYGQPEGPPPVPPKSADRLQPSAVTSPVRGVVRPQPTDNEKQQSKSESVTLPSLVVTQITEVSPASSSIKTPSKTATLIEMYRSKEAKGASVSPLQPSRLPVRILPTTPPKELPVLPPAASAAPAAPATPPRSRSPSPSPPPPTLETTPDIEPPRIGLEETGRGSPARYVHGAPLHNVMEEDEEDDI